MSDLIIELAPLPPVGGGPSERLVDDLGYDSLGLIELAAVLERELDLPRIEEQDAMGAETIGDVQALVLRLLAAAP